jgi:hypothetical protein
MDRVDDALRNIDSTLAVCEPALERAKVLIVSEERYAEVHQRPDSWPTPADAFTERALPTPQPGSWTRFWNRLVYLVRLEWWPETAPTGRGIVVLSDTPVVPISHTDPDHPPAPDFND